MGTVGLRQTTQSDRVQDALLEILSLPFLLDGLLRGFFSSSHVSIYICGLITKMNNPQSRTMLAAL